jgi:hypothetical protein
MNKRELEQLKQKINKDMENACGFDIPDISEAKSKKEIHAKALAQLKWWGGGGSFPIYLF